MPPNILSKGYQPVFNKRKINLRTKAFWSFIVFLIFLSFLYFLLFPMLEYLKIREIILVGKKADYSLIGIDNLKNINFLFLLIKKRELADELKIKNSIVESVNIEPIFPNKIKLTVKFYSPAAVLIGRDNLFYLAYDGRILFKTKKQKDNQLPLINYYQRLTDQLWSTGSYLSFSDLKATLYFIQFFKEIEYQVKEVIIKSEDMIIFLSDSNRQILLTNKKDERQQAAQLKIIIKQLKIKGKDFKKIDLRFDKPVIVF